MLDPFVVYPLGGAVRKVFVHNHQECSLLGDMAWVEGWVA